MGPGETVAGRDEGTSALVGDPTVAPESMGQPEPVGESIDTPVDSADAESSRPEPSVRPLADAPEAQDVGSSVGVAEELNGRLDEILGGLKPVAKALFVGRFHDLPSGGVEFQLDNPSISDRAQGRLADFADRVADVAGRSVPITLGAAAGDQSGRHGRTSHARSQDSSPPPPSDDPDWGDEVDVVDVHDLEDADPQIGAAQRLLEAFPGAEIVPRTGTGS